ncbi:MAG: hypothetical protein LBV30_06900 [Propionibacteriaceae bacterium]|jgi:spermidine synthase|nr:hypothetical protein [Propionibacteriaceae bacterium]
MADEHSVILAAAEPDDYEIALRRRTIGHHLVDELIINGAFAMDSDHTNSEIALADALGPNPGSVLVGGLGLGFTAKRLLDNGAEHLDIVELAGPLIDWACQGLTPTLAEVAADPRANLRQGDVTSLLLNQPGLPGVFGPWDGICLDIDNGPNFLIHESNASLYSPTGIRQAVDHLLPGGAMSIWCEGPSKEFWYDLLTVDPGATEQLIEVERGNRRLDYAIYTVRRPID